MKNKTKNKTGAKSGMRVKGKNKPVQPIKRETVQRAKERNQSLAKPKCAASGIFKGATEISVTENKIAVTRNMSHSAKGSFVQTETRVYHDMTPANVSALRKVVNGNDVKKITVKLKK